MRYMPAALLFIIVMVYVAGRTYAAVTIVRFTIAAEDDQVRLEWETLEEPEHSRCSVWRSTTFDERGNVIFVIDLERDESVDTIPSRGSEETGATYTALDTTVETGERYYYTLEALDIFGYSVFYTPVPRSVVVGEATATATSTPTLTPTATVGVTATVTATGTMTTTKTSTVSPTSGSTPTPSATVAATMTQPASPTSTATPPSATPSPTSIPSTAQSTNTSRAIPPTPASTPTPASDGPTDADSDAYPAPGSAEDDAANPSPVTIPTTSAPTAPAARAYVPPAEVQIPTTIVQPPSRFDVLDFFGRILLAVIAVTIVSLIGAALWVLRL